RRWDSCTGMWAAPIRVDGGFDQNNDSAETPSSHNVALAYDRSNGTLGVAYETQDPGDSHYEIRYAQLPRGASRFSAIERVQVQGDPTHDQQRLFNPGLAMANGNAFLAYQVGFLITGATAGVAYRSRASDGTWSAAQTVQHSEGNHSVFGVTSMAVDS